MSKHHLFAALSILVFCSISFGQAAEKPDTLQISTDIGKEFDEKLSQTNANEHKKSVHKPFSTFNFPRTAYTGSAGTGPIALSDPDFQGIQFMVGNHDEFRNLFPKDSKDEYQVFFAMITYSKFTSSSPQLVSSRNFPKYYIGQGSLESKSSKIDYFVFIDSNGKSYAIVNGKIFDLTENGKTLILLPSEDGSMNFIQVKTPYLTNAIAMVKNYYDNLLKSDEIKALVGKVKKNKV